MTREPDEDAQQDQAGALDDDEDDDEEFFKAWDEAEAHAVSVLRHALPELANQDPPQVALAAAADQLRAGMNQGIWPYRHMLRAAGFQEKLPDSDLELWLGAAGAYISLREESEMSAEEQASLMSQEHGDWVGAIVGLVRAGVGASAEPKDLVRYINECPEVEGDVDPEDALMVRGAFELILPAWEAAEAVDTHRRLTPLGRWGLPRALAWAWQSDFDAPGDESQEP